MKLTTITMVSVDGVMHGLGDAYEVAVLEPNRFLRLYGLNDLRGYWLDRTQLRPSAYSEGLWGFRLTRSTALPVGPREAGQGILAGVKPEDFLDGHPIAMSVYERLRCELLDIGEFEVRTSKSQIAFGAKRRFAYLSLPSQYLKNPGVEVVLSIALGRHDRSISVKDVVRPAARHWMLHGR